MDPYYHNNSAMPGPQGGIGFVMPPPLPNSGASNYGYPPSSGHAAPMYPQSSGPAAPMYPPQSQAPAAPMYPQMNNPSPGAPYENHTPLIDRPYDPYAHQAGAPQYGPQPTMPNAYPQAPQGGPYYQNQGHPPQGSPYNNNYPPGQKSPGGGLLDNAGKMLAGGLAGAGLGKLATKIPGMGGKSGHGQYPGGGHQGHSSGGGGGFPGGAGGALGGAAALGLGGALAAKMLKPKKMKKNKMLKYGLPLAGVGIGGYALKKGMHGFHRSSSSSSSSDSD